MFRADLFPTYSHFLLLLVFSLAIARRDPAHPGGAQAEQNRNADAGQELHHGADQRHLRHARRRKTLQVGSVVEIRRENLKKKEKKRKPPFFFQPVPPGTSSPKYYRNEILKNINP